MEKKGPKEKQKDFLKIPPPSGLAPLAPPPTGSATGNPRNKVALMPGFSLMDWIRLTKSAKDLAGTGGQLLQVTHKELAKHNKRKDAWMAINGIVYNVTPYMEYHPGGWDELIKGAGKDATKLFNEVHSWVNYQSMLSACLVGKLIGDFPSPASMPNDKVLPPIFGTSGREKPKLDWHQTNEALSLSIYTRRKNLLGPEDVIVEYKRKEKLFHILLYLRDDGTAYNLAYMLENDLDNVNPLQVLVYSNSGKVEVTLRKGSEKRWARIGHALAGNDVWGPQIELPVVSTDDFPEYRQWTLEARVPVTTDVDHYILKPPHDGLHFVVPCGHHVKMRMEVEGTELMRNYTPTLDDLNLEAIKEEAHLDPKLHFLIKSYSNGALTHHIKALPIGSKIDVSNHSGQFRLSWLADINNLVLIAGGTGFTPMAKLIQNMAHLCTLDHEKGRQIERIVTLLFFNKTDKDMIWGLSLDEAVAKAKTMANFKFHVHHILSQDPDWSGHKGRIRPDLLHKLVPSHPPSLTLLKKYACICGPIPFTREAKRLLLEELNFSCKDIHVFQG